MWWFGAIAPAVSLLNSANGPQRSLALYVLWISWIPCVNLRGADRFCLDFGRLWLNTPGVPRIDPGKGKLSPVHQPVDMR